MPFTNQKYCSSTTRYQLLLPRVWAFLLVILWLLILNIKPLFSQEEFVVVSEEKSDSEYSNQDAKTLAKISKKNFSPSKNKNDTSIPSKNKEELTHKDEETQASKNIYDFSEDDVAGINVLMMAVNNNDVQGVRFFSKAGGVLINQKNLGGATALHIASREGNYEITKILIEGGANVNVADNEGWTPLMRANLNGHHQIVDLLITKGANAGGLNNVGESVIMHATLANCDKCLNIMLEKLNFSKQFSTKLLKEQITDSFIISRNRENSVIQGLLESYLDRLIKVSPVISNEDFKKKMAQTDEQNLNRSKIIEDLNSKDQQKKIIYKESDQEAVIVADFIDKKENLKKIERLKKSGEIEEKYKITKVNDKNNSSKKILLNKESSKSLNDKTESLIKIPVKYNLIKTSEDNKKNIEKVSNGNNKLQNYFLNKPSGINQNPDLKRVYVLKTFDKYNLNSPNYSSSSNVLAKNLPYSNNKQIEVKDQINKIIENNKKQVLDNRNKKQIVNVNNDSKKTINDKINDDTKIKESANKKIADDNQKASLVKSSKLSSNNKTDLKDNVLIKKNNSYTQDNLSEDDYNKNLSTNSSSQLHSKKKKFIIGIIRDEEDVIMKQESNSIINKSSTNKSNVNSKK